MIVSVWKTLKFFKSGCRTKQQEERLTKGASADDGAEPILVGNLVAHGQPGRREGLLRGRRRGRGRHGSRFPFSSAERAEESNLSLGKVPQMASGDEGLR